MEQKQQVSSRSGFFWKKVLISVAWRTFAQTVVLEFAIHVTIATNPGKLGMVIKDDNDLKKHEKFKSLSRIKIKL